MADLPRQAFLNTREENVHILAQTFVNSSKNHAAAASTELDISDRSVRRILKALHMKPLSSGI